MSGVIHRLTYMLPECVLIVGPSGCGKTYALLNDILMVEKSEVYDYVFVLCSTFDINETYQEWVGLKDKCVFGVSIASEKLDAVINFIVKSFGGSKVAVVIDDMSSSGEQHLNFGMVTYLAYSGRHHEISLFILSQRLCSVSTGVRDNVTRILFFPTHCKRSIRTLRDEFFGQLSGEEEKTLLTDLRKPESLYLDLDMTARTCGIKHK